MSLEVISENIFNWDNFSKYQQQAWTGRFEQSFRRGFEVEGWQ